jgi:hypothetical protein
MLRVRIWKTVRSPWLPRSTGLVGAEILFVANENDHHVTCAAATANKQHAET